jgi:preprotein translocase subunit YajC
MFQFIVDVAIFAQNAVQGQAPQAPAAAPQVAEQVAQSAPKAQGGDWTSLLIMLGIPVVFFLILFLPEMRRRKKMKQQLASLKKGDKVITAGGIIGVIDFVGEKTVYLKTQDSKIEVAKEYVGFVFSNEPDQKS